MSAHEISGPNDTYVEVLQQINLGLIHVRGLIGVEMAHKP